MNIISHSELISKKSDITYQDLMQTFEWRSKRNEILERDYKRCTKCQFSETFGHKSSVTGKYSYIADNGGENQLTFTNKDGIIITESEPILVVTDKPYFLHVHHKYYVYTQLPWEYEDQALVTLCNWCHAEVHQHETIVMYFDTTSNCFENLIPCKRCNGAGWFPEYKHIHSGICYECHGARFSKPLFKK